MAYDQKFHLGTNIIRGENGSGKSTISDFIFFVLGGEFDAWKDAARACDEVQAEVETAAGIITIRRSIASKLEPAFVFFGTMTEANTSGIDGWQRFAIRRSPSDTSLSFSQMFFRSAGIPEATASAGHNITAHQILRLMYSDQQTPAGKLFRFEAFDTKDIRQAVGDLMIGVNSYRLYEAQIALRQLKSEYADKDRLYTAALAALPRSEGISNLSSLDTRMVELRTRQKELTAEIEAVDQLVNSGQSNEFVADREKMRRSLLKASTSLVEEEQRLVNTEFEIGEIEQFLGYLEELLAKLDEASSISSLLGELEFRYCPACLKPLPEHGDGHCVVCGTELDAEKQRSKYLELKIDNELQVKETRHLLGVKVAARDDLARDIRETRRTYKDQVQEFASRYDQGNAPREAFLAQRHRLLGSLEREAEHLDELREALVRLDKLSSDRADLNQKIASLEASVSRLFAASQNRTNQAMSLISEIGRSILRDDLPRQEEFQNPRTFSINFADDAIFVDGKMNFAESSNVIAKNAAILSLISAATIDEDFWHPRFVLFDNVEDKGMEMVRSHNFQKLIVQRSKSARLRHQIIFSTSMMDPDLEKSDLTVGPSYTRTNRALQLA